MLSVVYCEINTFWCFVFIVYVNLYDCTTHKNHNLISKFVDFSSAWVTNVFQFLQPLCKWYYYYLGISMRCSSDFFFLAFFHFLPYWFYPAVAYSFYFFGVLCQTFSFCLFSLPIKSPDRHTYNISSPSISCSNVWRVFLSFCLRGMGAGCWQPHTKYTTHPAQLRYSRGGMFFHQHMIVQEHDPATYLYNCMTFSVMVREHICMYSPGADRIC